MEIGPSIRDYYGVPAHENITHLAFVFRSADSSKEGKDDGGKDIFAAVFDDDYAVTIIQPDKNLVVIVGDTIPFEAASNLTSDLSLFMGETLIKSVNGTSISYSFIMDVSGDYWFHVSASSGDEQAADSVFVHVLETMSEVPLPDTLVDGISYVNNEMVQLVLYAPGKEHVFVIGDFNNWTPGSGSRMNKDGSRFWITLDGLESGTEYAFQYLVDGVLNIADPYSEKVLDPWNDKWIPEEIWSALINLKLSEAGKRIEINHASMDVRIIGNFGVESLSVNPSFSKSGWWYGYFEGDSIDVSDLQEPIMLGPGEYRLFTSKRLILPDITTNCRYIPIRLKECSTWSRRRTPGSLS